MYNLAAFTHVDPIRGLAFPISQFVLLQHLRGEAVVLAYIANSIKHITIGFPMPTTKNLGVHRAIALVTAHILFIYDLCCTSAVGVPIGWLK